MVVAIVEAAESPEGPEREQRYDPAVGSGRALDVEIVEIDADGCPVLHLMTVGVEAASRPPAGHCRLRPSTLLHLPGRHTAEAVRDAMEDMPAHCLPWGQLKLARSRA
jgi:hypothetical protein